MSLVYELRDTCDNLVVSCADTLHVSVYDFTYEKRNVRTLKLEVLHEAVIDSLELAWPVRVSGVRLTLVDEDTLDHTVLLSDLRHLDKSCIRVVVVSCEHALHPAWCSLCNIVVDAVRKECLDMASADSYMNDTYLNLLWKVSHECSSEIVCRSKTCARTAERRNCCVPFALNSSHLRVVDYRHHLEAVTYVFQILLLDSCVAFHIGLAEA